MGQGPLPVGILAGRGRVLGETRLGEEPGQIVLGDDLARQ